MAASSSLALGDDISKTEETTTEEETEMLRRKMFRPISDSNISTEEDEGVEMTFNEEQSASISSQLLRSHSEAELTELTPSTVMHDGDNDDHTSTAEKTNQQQRSSPLNWLRPNAWSQLSAAAAVGDERLERTPVGRDHSQTVAVADQQRSMSEDSEWDALTTVARRRLPSVRSISDLHELSIKEAKEGVDEVTKAQLKEKSLNVITSFIPGVRSVPPLIYMMVYPVAITVLHYTLTELDGSLRRLSLEFLASGSHWYRTLYDMRQDAFHVNGWGILIGLIVLQWLMTVFIPGRTVMGPLTKGGYAPIYRTNGLSCFLITIGLYHVGVQLQLYPGGFINENLGYYIAAATVFFPILCALLYLKGRIDPLNEGDARLTGDAYADYFSGVELHPKAFGVYLKHFFTYRVAVNFWALLVVSSVYKQYETFHQITPAMIVSAALHLMRLCRFQFWEAGYLSTRAETVDRAGFRQFWGSCVALPVIYSSQVIYMVYNPSQMGLMTCIALLIAGILCLYTGYEADVQKQLVREHGDEAMIWGVKPKFIRARYWTEDGQVRMSLLLRSGWWGLARHFNYVPEVLFGVCMTLPVFTRQPLAYLYIPFITLLLLHRAIVDDKRCKRKYVGYWESYSYYVPELLIPGVF